MASNNNVYRLVLIPGSDAYSIAETPQTLDSENGMTEGGLCKPVPTQVKVRLPNGTEAVVGALVEFGDLFWLTDEGLATLDSIDAGG